MSEKDEKVKKEPKAKRQPVLLRPYLTDDPTTQKEKMAELKAWFEENFPLDPRAEVVIPIQKYVNMEDTQMMKLGISELNRLEWKLSQYSMTLGEYVSELTRNYNFSYIYRKFQYSNKWTTMRDAVISDGEKITNGELDELSEVSVWQERAIEVFMQERCDTMRNILDAAQSIIFVIRGRIRELERQSRLKETDNYSQRYGRQ